MPKKKAQKELQVRNSTAEFLTFAYQTGGDGVEVRVQDGMVWLSQRNIAMLFETTIQNVNIHMNNIFQEGELDETSTIKEYLIVQSEGDRLIERSIKHYNLDVIIAVGYRVNTIMSLQRKVVNGHIGYLLHTEGQTDNSPFLWKGGTPCYAHRGGKGGLRSIRVNRIPPLPPLESSKKSPLSKGKGNYSPEPLLMTVSISDFSEMTQSVTIRGTIC